MFAEMTIIIAAQLWSFSFNLIMCGEHNCQSSEANSHQQDFEPMTSRASVLCSTTVRQSAPTNK